MQVAVRVNDVSTPFFQDDMLQVVCTPLQIPHNTYKLNITPPSYLGLPSRRQINRTPKNPLDHRFGHRFRRRETLTQAPGQAQA